MRTFIIALLSLSLVNTLTKSSSEMASAPEGSAICVDNTHSIEQKIVVTCPTKNSTDCTQSHGKEFMECMRCQSPESLKTNIIRCNDRMAHYYFLNLSLEEYQETLEQVSEKEWEHFYATRSKEYQKRFPSNKEAQMIMLKEIYLNASYTLLEQLWHRQSPLNTDDLPTIINDYRARRIHGTMSDETHAHTLKQFHLRRNFLFSVRQAG